MFLTMLLSGVVSGQQNIPDSSVDAVHKAPGDYPAGKDGDVLTVEFTVMRIPCLGLNGGPEFKSRSRKTDREANEFFDRSPKMNPNASLIKGVVCGIHSND